MQQNQRPRLLVVDDDRAILTLIGTLALAEGFDVATTVNGEDAMNQLRHRPAELVLLDLRMPGITGLDVLRSIRDVSPKCKVVLMTGFATIDSAVEAVKLGALDYLTKPFDLQRLRQLLATVRDEAAQRREVLTLEGDLAQRLEFCGMVGRGPAMQDVFGLIRRLAPHVRTALTKSEISRNFGETLWHVILRWASAAVASNRVVPGLRANSRQPAAQEARSFTR